MLELPAGHHWVQKVSMVLCGCHGKSSGVSCVQLENRCSVSIQGKHVQTPTEKETVPKGLGSHGQWPEVECHKQAVVENEGYHLKQGEQVLSFLCAESSGTVSEDIPMAQEVDGAAGMLDGIHV